MIIEAVLKPFGRAWAIKWSHLHCNNSKILPNMVFWRLATHTFLVFPIKKLQKINIARGGTFHLIETFCFWGFWETPFLDLLDLKEVGNGKKWWFLGFPVLDQFWRSKSTVFDQKSCNLSWYFTWPVLSTKKLQILKVQNRRVLGKKIGVFEGKKMTFFIGFS